MEKYIMKGVKIAFMILAALVFAALFAAGVMYLWNWLMPDLFGLKMIGYWQAIGLLVLSKILFSGWSGGGHKKCDHCKSKWQDQQGTDKYSMKAKFMEKWSNCHAEESKSSEDEEDTITSD